MTQVLLPASQASKGKGNGSNGKKATTDVAKGDKNGKSGIENLPLQIYSRVMFKVLRTGRSRPIDEKSGDSNYAQIKVLKMDPDVRIPETHLPAFMGTWLVQPLKKHASVKTCGDAVKFGKTEKPMVELKNGQVFVGLSIYKPATYDFDIVCLVTEAEYEAAKTGSSTPNQPTAPQGNQQENKTQTKKKGPQKKAKKVA